MILIPDDRYYNAEPESECNGEEWQTCPCEECQNIREARANERYQRRRDEEFDK